MADYASNLIEALRRQTPLGANPTMSGVTLLPNPVVFYAPLPTRPPRARASVFSPPVLLMPSSPIRQTPAVNQNNPASVLPPTFDSIGGDSTPQGSYSPSQSGSSQLAPVESRNVGRGGGGEPYYAPTMAVQKTDPIAESFGVVDYSPSITVSNVDPVAQSFPVIDYAPTITARDVEPVAQSFPVIDYAPTITVQDVQPVAESFPVADYSPTSTGVLSDFDTVSAIGLDALGPGAEYGMALGADGSMGFGIEGGSYGGADGGGGGGGKIICTKLHEIGLMPSHIFEADQDFGRQMAKQNPTAMAGYHALARPVVDLMSKPGVVGKVVTKLAYWIATPWANEMARRMGVHERKTVAGWVLMEGGVRLCSLVGRVVQRRHAFSH